MSRRSFFGRKSTRPTKSRRPERFRIEKLEDRQLMAADVVEAYIDQGTLYIRGTQGPDHIQVRLENGAVTIPGVQIKNSAGVLVPFVSRDEVPYQVIAMGQDGDDVIEIVEAGDAPLPVVFFGNRGDDFLIGGSSDDVLVGQEGHDYLYGNGGNDKLIAALNADVTDLPNPTDNDEVLDGGAGNDKLYGSPGRDVLLGGDGNDQLYGLNGDDRLEGGAGLDSYDGGAGVDDLIERDLTIASLSNTGFSVSGVDEFGNQWGMAAAVEGIERAMLFADPNSGGATIDASGFAGQVTIVGSNGPDVLKGGAGKDFIYGLGGDDQLHVGGGLSNLAYGGEGRDTLFAQLGAHNVQISDGRYSTRGAAAWLDSVEDAVFAEIADAMKSSPAARPAFGLNTANPIVPTSTPAKPTIDALNFTGNVNVMNAAGQDVTATKLVEGLLFGKNESVLSNSLNTKPEILKLYKEMDGRNGVLGAAIKFPGNFAGGQWVEYERGIIYTSQHGTFAIHGDLWTEYDRLKQHDGDLGLPIGPITESGSGPDRFSHIAFENGGIFDTRFGAFAVQGGVWAEYNRLGRDFSGLGSPTGPLTHGGSGLTSYAQLTFERGTIVSSTRGAYVITGEIFEKFRDGGVAKYGRPTSWFQVTAMHQTVGIVQHFTGGDIYASPHTGAHFVGRQFASRYDQQSERDILGFPISDTIDASGGAYVKLQRGAIFNSPQTGVHTTAGLFYFWFEQYGGVNTFGFPTMEPTEVTYRNTGHGWDQYFQRGHMYLLDRPDGHFVLSYNAYGQIDTIFRNDPPDPDFEESDNGGTMWPW